MNSNSRKCSSKIVILFLLLCFFWGLNNDNQIKITGSTNSSQTGYINEAVGLSEIIGSEEISVSTSQAVSFRQLSSKKSSNVFYEISLVVIITITFLFIAFLAFISICADNIVFSHIHILDYIHKKDGQKS